MKTLNILVTNRVANYRQRDGFIICGNSDYQITFTFDSEWSGYAVKTVRFKWNGTYQDVVVSSTNTVTVPKITNATQVEVGVYSDDLCTTTPATIPCVKSILCGENTPAAPASDVYSQIIQMMNNGLIKGEDGVTPTIEISTDGFWIINGVKTAYKAIGVDGEDGIDGVTPTISISDDNYWVINGVKTSHKSKGDKGDPGADLCAREVTLEYHAADIETGEIDEFFAHGAIELSLMTSNKSPIVNDNSMDSVRAVLGDIDDRVVLRKKLKLIPSNFGNDSPTAVRYDITSIEIEKVSPNEDLYNLYIYYVDTTGAANYITILENPGLNRQTVWNISEEIKSI